METAPTARSLEEQISPLQELRRKGINKSKPKAQQNVWNRRQLPNFLTLAQAPAATRRGLAQVARRPREQVFGRQQE